MKQLYSFVGACLSAALLAACGNGFSSSAPTSVGSQSGTQTVRSQPALVRSETHKVGKAVETMTYLHSFGASGDGYAPHGPLVSVNGTLYGTTTSDNTNDNGTVYSITPSGTYSLLYSFAGSPDGSSPYAGLLAFNGTLYGTTAGGGAYGGGTVYSITPSGTESVIESFYPGSDGQTPYANLIAVGSKFYGTTEAGGVYNAGTVFSMTASGVESVLHSFGGAGDGTNPEAPLLYSNGTLYGTTTSGGTYGGGTVFAISKSSGAETVLHSFYSSGDGSNPQYGRLALLNGTLYGTTSSAGAQGYGTVFSISPTPSGTYTTLHNFARQTDGAYPAAGLVVNNGLLYGTTTSGGAYNHGTIYSITPSGTETVIWAFGGSPGGSAPSDDLIVVKGTLYGTTLSGGANNRGTVFSLLSL
jgi:uncharacterized repeat protein (TIGR03803 family)